jgi:hypothetical protein
MSSYRDNIYFRYRSIIVNFPKILSILFDLLLIIQVKFVKHVNGFLSHCMSLYVKATGINKINCGVTDKIL